MEPGSTGNSGRQGRHHPPEQDLNQDGDQGIDEVTAPAGNRGVDGRGADGRDVDGHSAGGRGAGPVAEDGDSWATAVDAPVWSAPDDLPSRRGRTAKIAVGGTAFVGIVLAVAIPLQRAPGDHHGSVPAPGQALPPVAASTDTSASASNTAQPPTPTPTKSGARTRPAPGPRTASPTPAPSASTWTNLTIAATKVMFRGNSVQTNRTRLLLQTNGELVVIDEFQAVRWRSDTAGTGDHAVFQADGNFVVYTILNGTRWTSNTAGHDGAQLVLKADGDVCIVFNGSVIWSAGTAH